MWEIDTAHLPLDHNKNLSSCYGLGGPYPSLTDDVSLSYSQKSQGQNTNQHQLLSPLHL